ncbi:PKD domain-containing protein [Cohnella herbarum]|uniref:PKD/Chitinase domain-containing protein n=1 Tax=Cohnella herbarum TaxID=2728023 RepID=A0A7Z2VJE9_9BACL|nr:PKD domain-containing protein [Cohnella herbarum]QJD84070.1 hypothetical protein HH215_13320 [Cohnella herbarum]
MKVLRVFVPVVFEIELQGQLEVHHYTTSGQNIDSQFPDQSTNMISGQTYSIVPATNPAYSYVGYKKSTVGVPTGGTRIDEVPPSFLYNGTYDTYYLNLYYQQDGGTINVRHMVKAGPTGTYTQKGTETITADKLPATQTVNPKSSYGKVIGGNVSYTGFSDQVLSVKVATVNLSSSQKTGNVTFFYENSLNITGNFDILPSQNIKWRDSFTLKPKDFVIPATCTYLYHEYLIEKDGFTWTSSKVRGQTTDSPFAYSNYPSNLGVGTNFISIKVTADCANSGWVNIKPLTIESPASNRPPDFSVGFFRENNRSGIFPDQEVVINQRVNVRVIQDNTKNPPLPNDPDGDAITYTWLFGNSSSAWVRSFPDEYGAWEHDEGHYNLKATELGSHSVTVIARDTFGAESRRTAYINVIPENPIAKIDGPTKVKENRPLPQPFTGERSYSPIGRAISQYLWDNKRDVYATPGTETIKLDVVDSAGLKSLYPAQATLLVIPDDPPIGKLDVPPLGIRVNDYNIFNKSYSPDGDKIVSISYRYKYDANNDGIYDEAWTTLTGGNLTKVILRPAKVGKYLIDARVCEDWGKCAWVSDTQPESTRIIDAVNLAPSVSFLIEGENEIPKPPTDDSIPASEILKWDLYDVNTTSKTTNSPYKWSKDGKTLLAGLGKGMERQFRTMASVGFGGGGWDSQSGFPSLTDNGFGPNNLSPYKSMAWRDSSRSQPLLVPTKWSGYTAGDDYTNLSVARFYNKVRTNKTYMYFDQGDTQGDNIYIFALNKKKIPAYSTEYRLTCGGSTDMSLCNGYNWEQNLVHKWNGPNPYDFILNLSNSTAPKYSVPYYSEDDKKNASNWYSQADSGDFSKASSSAQVQLKPLTYEITGSRIYVVYQRMMFAAYYYSEGKGSSTSYYPGSKNYLDIHTFDAYTGEFLASSYDKGERVKLAGGSVVSSVHGDNLVLTPNWGSHTIQEFDRQGKLAVQKDLSLPATQDTYARKGRNGLGIPFTEDPMLYTCSWSAMSKMDWKDTDGNRYLYMINTCSRPAQNDTINLDPDFNPESPAGLYLVQVKPNYSIGIKARIKGTTLTETRPGPYDLNLETIPVLAINPITKQAITRSTKPIWNSMWGSDYFSNLVDLTTGAVSDWGMARPSSSVQRNGGGFTIGHNGSFGYGWATNTIDNAFVKHDNFSSFEYMKRAYPMVVSGETTKYIRFGEYVGDGVYLSMYDTDYWMNAPGGGGGGPSSSAHMFLDVGTPVNAEVYKGFQLGQFVSPDAYEDAEYTFTVNMDAPQEDATLAGLSFRMTNPKYRYAVEMDGSKIFLSKYVNGNRTVLDSNDFPFQSHTDYGFKILTQGDEIAVFMDGVPYFEVTDATYQSGKFGPFSDKSYVSFSGISQKDLSNPDVEWLSSYAIWDEGSATANVRYSNIVYTDPENDPAAQNNLWTISHTPKFLNNQGLSALHGQTLASPALIFDKVGNYRVTLKAQDDPHPNYLFPATEFGNYRKWSNEFWQIITVHRRPVSQFTVSVHPVNKSVVWSDESYDPDRWLSATKYSTEATGIDYRATRGVLEWRHYYVTPNGTMVNQKLVTPQEVGEYRVGMQVKDEYSAWSYWTEQTIEIDTPVVPDDPPIAGFTITPGSSYMNLPFSVTSTAHDKEDGPAANLKHAYYVRNVTENSLETIRSTDRGTWTTSFSSLGVIEVRQVVTDSKGQSAQITQRISIINRGPIADFDWLPKPVFEGDNVNIANRSTDPDGDPLSYLWTIVAPDAERKTGSTKDTNIVGGETINRAGVYLVTLLVTDIHGATDSVTKPIPIGELTISGKVSHTPEWEANRWNWNTKYPGKYRGEDVFWAGEAFVLEAIVTDTGASGTRAIAVKAAATAELKKSLKPASPISTLWNEILRERDTVLIFEELPNGPYEFEFTVNYSNGVMKSTVVPIEIRNRVDEYVQVHRVQ